MHKFATTVLALALATTHGLLDEGGPIVQRIPTAADDDSEHAPVQRPERTF